MHNRLACFGISCFQAISETLVLGRFFDLHTDNIFLLENFFHFKAYLREPSLLLKIPFCFYIFSVPRRPFSIKASRTKFQWHFCGTDILYPFYGVFPFFGYFDTLVDSFYINGYRSGQAEKVTRLYPWDCTTDTPVQFLYELSIQVVLIHPY